MAKKHKQATQNSTILSPETMSSLGISQQPFTNAILSANAIFTHAALTQLRDTLKHHLQFSELLLIIEGDFGSGKTTLFRQLMQEEIPNIFLMPIQAEATDTLVQIQQKMSIHLKEQGNANYLDDNLKNLQMFDQTPVLMIDDAHVLSDTTIQEIIRYRQQLLGEKELQLKTLLFANRGMAATIEQISDIQHNQLFVQEMPALSAKQIQTFIDHRLSMAGVQQPPLLDEKSIQMILKKSAGNPLLVMQHAMPVLEKLCKQSGRSFSLALPGKASLLFTLLIIIAAAVIGGYFYLGTSQQVQITEHRPPAPPPASTTYTDNTVSEQPSPADMQEEPLIEANNDTIETEQPPMMALDESGPTGNEPVAIDIPQDEEVPLPAPAEQDQLEEPVSAAVDSSPAVIKAPDVAPPPAPMEAKVAPAAPQPARTVPPAPVATEPALVTTVQDPALKALADLGIKDSSWLLQQNPQYWTLQVLGARDPETLVKFIKQHQLHDDIAWYQTDLKGKPWYVLVYRFYTEKEIARQSIQRLPEGIKKSSPWVKSIASVQKSIKP